MAEGTEGRAGRRLVVLLWWSVCALSLLLIALTLAFHLTTRYDWWFGGTFNPWRMFTVEAIAALGAPILGGLIVGRQPGNRYGWLWCLLGLGMALRGAAYAYEIWALYVAPYRDAVIHRSRLATKPVRATLTGGHASGMAGEIAVGSVWPRRAPARAMGGALLCSCAWWGPVRAGAWMWAVGLAHPWPSWLGLPAGVGDGDGGDLRDRLQPVDLAGGEAAAAPGHHLAGDALVEGEHLAGAAGHPEVGRLAVVAGALVHQRDAAGRAVEQPGRVVKDPVQHRADPHLLRQVLGQGLEGAAGRARGGAVRLLTHAGLPRSDGLVPDAPVCEGQHHQNGDQRRHEQDVNQAPLPVRPSAQEPATRRSPCQALLGGSLAASAPQIRPEPFTTCGKCRTAL